MTTTTGERTAENSGQIAPVVSAVKKMPPANPFFEKNYVGSLTTGEVKITIPAPGGEITEHDAKDIIDLFGLITRQLQREIERTKTVQAAQAEFGDSVIRVGWQYVLTAMTRPELKRVCTWPNGDEGFVFNESR